MALTTVPASLSATAITLTTAAQPNITSVGTLTSLTVSGNTALTLNTSAQPNITSVGTLTALTLSGALTLNTGTNGVPTINLSHSNSDADNFRIQSGIPGTSNGGFTIRDVDAGANRFIIDSSGNISTGSNLSVGTTNTSQFVTILKDHTGYTDIGVSNNTSNSDLYLGVGGSGAGNSDLVNAAYVLAGGASSSLVLGANTDEKMRILASGNVGIGTNNPNQIFHIKNTGQHTTMRIENGNADFLIQAGDAGDDGLHFYDNANTAYRMTIDNAGQVGIGTTTPVTPLTINGTDPLITFENGESPHWQIGFENTQSDRFVIYDNNATSYRLIIDSNGTAGFAGNVTAPNLINIGTDSAIQTTSARQWATIKNTGTGTSDYSEMKWMNNNNNYLVIGTIGSNYNQVDWSGSSYIYSDYEMRIKSQQGIRFYVGGFSHTANNRMTLDQNGNLLVGTADTTLYNNTSGGGIMLAAANRFDAARAGDVVATFNRSDSDGQVIQVYRSGTQVGSVSAEGGDSMIVSGGSAATSGGGLLFHGGAGKVLPARNTASIDATIDLGQASRRFKDIYISGGINFSDASGGVGYSAGNAANTLDDYEEGTWTPTWTGDSSITVNEAKYTRIGGLCYIYFYISAVLPDTSNAGQTIYGLPFTCRAGANYPGLTFAYTGTANLHGTFPGITALIAQNATYIYFHRNDGNAGTVSRAQFRSMAGATDMALILSGCYHVQ